MTDLAENRGDYLALVSGGADQLARLGYLWQPRFGEVSATDGEAKLLAFTPVARRNGFQSLLYRAAWEHGFAPIPVPDIFALQHIPWPGPMACHFHWLGGLTRGSSSEAEADEQVRAFEQLLNSLKDQGRQIVWTVHNALPHDTKWPEQDLQIRKLISGAADLIHIMTTGTADALKDYYCLPTDKVALIPHPSYAGFYADTVTRFEARARLGIPHDSHTFLVFGAIQRYKGYERLIEAYGRLASAPGQTRPFLIIAGKSADTDLSRELRAWAFTRRDVLIHVKPVPNEDIQLYYRASDVAVCPYTATLNSGAALLAITFGKPVVGPRTGGFVDNVGSTCAWLYDPVDSGSNSLLNAMRESLIPGALQAKTAAAGERARLLSADTISTRFFAQLTSLFRT